jgi:hypothetical protein
VSPETVLVALAVLMLAEVDAVTPVTIPGVPELAEEDADEESGILAAGVFVASDVVDVDVATFPDSASEEPPGGVLLAFSASTVEVEGFCVVVVDAGSI